MWIDTTYFHFAGFGRGGAFSFGLGQEHPRDADRRHFYYTYHGWRRGFWLEWGPNTFMFDRKPEHTFLLSIETVNREVAPHKFKLAEFDAWCGTWSITIRLNEPALLPRTISSDEDLALAPER